MSIVVVRKGYPNSIYIGRGSPLGNPFVMQNQSNAERQRVIAEFKAYFEDAVTCEGPLRQAVIDLYRRHHAGESLHLACFCAPLACHGDVIKAFIEAQPAPVA